MNPPPGDDLVPILVPTDLGTASQPLRVSAWFAELGENVEQGDRVVELLLSGMTFDLAAPVAGQLKGVEKHLDAPVAPGDVLGWIVPNSEED